MFNNDLLQNCYLEPESIKVSLLIDYLNYISGKELTLSIIRQYLLKVGWKENEVKLLSRCHCRAASIYLKHLLNTEKELNRNQIKIIIADIAFYIAKLDSSQDTSFIVISTNTLPSTIHFKHAQFLFYKHDLPEEAKNNYGSDLLVLYSLRLALESRIRGFLGIDYATINGKPVGVKWLLGISKSLKEIKFSPSIDWVQIEWVNIWLNHHMHRHLRPNPWTIHQAFEILNTILKPTTYNHGNREYHSFYASTIVYDEDQYFREIKTRLEENTGIEVKWSFNREILKLKKEI